MKDANIGLTELYNRYHSARANADIKIIELRRLHCDIDNAIIQAYGWSDIQLLHGFYEQDFLSERDNLRFSVHPLVRKELFVRLQQLNNKMCQDEKLDLTSTDNLTTRNKEINGLFN